MNLIIVHGGVETGTGPPYLEALGKAALAGYKALSKSLLDAAEETIKILEDDPLFNAGYGSVLNYDGEVEMDAAVMDGRTSGFGAVAAITGVAHPISVARLVLEKTSHVLLAGPGATKFARSQGFPEVNCVYPEMLAAWKRAREKIALSGSSRACPYTGLDDPGERACDTVGCVIFDRGMLAAASSTGGSFLKMPGRVGDTPVPGGGIFASGNCAVVCTGLGEAFIETLTAKYVDSLVRDGIHPREAAERAMKRLHRLKKGAVGGLVAVDSKMRYGAAYNCRRFPVAVFENGVVAGDYKPVKIKE
ncbi:isoaspartyl aminopeptidase [Desulfocucumis palustris]|uniref:Isoaspartyl aminopeptidase n=1 Tax=Desulfocucumis palustris TaxID=1898651 RepID=A0A2L2XFK1_9FIRM|nr:isoaspartyl peptidase/L-asparaginase family protein [Desulfocucumis palustris]GBF35018.1 isoaspartyl aminopeptidase [Desulfocucumis palustris]